MAAQGDLKQERQAPDQFPESLKDGNASVIRQGHETSFCKAEASSFSCPALEETPELSPLLLGLEDQLTVTQAACSGSHSKSLWKAVMML